jgi:hypothetical protein
MTQDATIALLDATQFDISGPIVISYSVSSIAGKPLFTYRDADRTLNFSGDEITRVPTTVGELVTVTLDIVVDAFVRTFTLVVPRVRGENGSSTEFETFGFETVDRSSGFVGPAGASGVLQTYDLHELCGVAQVVQF